MNIAIIQSRMGSQRLPGKMMKKIGNHTVIEWVIKRLKKSKSINQIILTTSRKKKDIIFKKISQKLKVNFFAGDEKDVLGRFLSSVSNIKKANIIRICAQILIILAFFIFETELRNLPKTSFSSPAKKLTFNF